MDADAVPEAPVRVEQGRFEGRFINFPFSCTKLFAIKNGVFQVVVIRLEQSRKVNTLVSSLFSISHYSSYLIGDVIFYSFKIVAERDRS